MIALDANILIYAAKRHLPTLVDPLLMLLVEGLDRLMRRCGKLKLGISSSAAGDAVIGAKTVKEQNIILTYLRKVEIWPDSQAVLTAAAAFRRQWPERARRKFAKDCVAYAAAAVHNASAFVTYDLGFIGVENKQKFMGRAKTLPSIPEPIMPTDERIGVSINPKRRKQRDVIAEHRERARRRAAKFVGNDPDAQMEFFRHVVRAFGLRVRK